MWFFCLFPKKERVVANANLIYCTKLKSKVNVLMLKILLILSKNKTGVKKKKKDMVEAKNAILIASTPTVIIYHPNHLQLLLLLFL